MSANIFELRQYHIGRDRRDDMKVRFKGVLPIFERHGIRVWGGWLTGHAAPSTRFVSIFEWASFDERTTALGRFAADAEWAVLRSATNQAGELVRRYDLFLMKPIPGIVPRQVAASGGGLFDLGITHVPNGHVDEARTLLLNETLPALASVGAEIIGWFELLSGPDLPAFVSLLHWPAGHGGDGMQNDESNSESAVRLTCARARYGSNINGLVLLNDASG